MQRRRLVRVPASSANLGPGFDALGMALDFHAEVGLLDESTSAAKNDKLSQLPAPPVFSMERTSSARFRLRTVVRTACPSANS